MLSGAGQVQLAIMHCTRAMQDHVVRQILLSCYNIFRWSRETNSQKSDARAEIASL